MFEKDCIMENFGEYLTINEAARKLGVSASTLRNWDKRGKLKSIRHPYNSYRIYRIEDIECILSSVGGATLKEPSPVYSLEKDIYQKKDILEFGKTQPIDNFLNKVIQGDCLEVMSHIPAKSIDMILCDLPYGTTQNKWDSLIDLDKLWQHYLRIVKDNGAIVLTSQGVFTAKLILSMEEFFRYKIVWIKSKSTNFLNAKKQPLRKHEDICIFYKKQPVYNPQMTQGKKYDKGVRKNQFTGSYGNFSPIHVKSNGLRYPSDIVFYEEIPDCVYFKTAESEGQVYHPTQKPVELGRYLVRTFTNPGDTILDNACGSGSFLVAAMLEHRNFIGIEKNDQPMLHKVKRTDYIKVCKDRLSAAKKKMEDDNSYLPF